MSFLSRYPELRHLLDTMRGAQAALALLIDRVHSTGDTSLIRIALSEAETVSKAAVKLSLGITALEAELATGVSPRAHTPTADPQAVFRLLEEAFPGLTDEDSEISRLLFQSKVDEARKHGIQSSWSVYDQLRVKEALELITEGEARDLEQLRRNRRA